MNLDACAVRSNYRAPSPGPTAGPEPLGKQLGLGSRGPALKPHASAGPGASTSYDWEGMNIALILRIFDHGLPDTQADLIAEMQEWFSDRSEGKKMPDSRSIRRRITPIWRALRREEA